LTLCQQKYDFQSSTESLAEGKGWAVLNLFAKMLKTASTAWICGLKQSKCKRLIAH